MAETLIAYSTRGGVTRESANKIAGILRKKCARASQLCSGCGEYIPKTLDVRVHRCPYCGLVLDRDVNAARVILRKGIGMVRAESMPVGDSASTDATMMQAESMKQEAHLFRGG